MGKNINSGDYYTNFFYSHNYSLQNFHRGFLKISSNFKSIRAKNICSRFSHFW